MKEQLRGFPKIFAFTFKQHAMSKGYKVSTIVIALLCLLIPAGIMIAMESLSTDSVPDAVVVEEAPNEYEVDMSAVKNIYTVDLSKDKEADLSHLPTMVNEVFGTNINVSDYGDDFDKARSDAKGSDDTLLIVTKQSGREYTMNILTPDESSLPLEVAHTFDSAMMAYADMLTVEHGGESNYYTDTNQSGDSEDSMEGIDGIVTIVLSFLTVMILYFFVLAYGQGVATSVVMEKSSKLIESFLVSVKPTAIILGKLLAITLTGIVQLFSWVISLALSFVIGTFAVKAINPETDMFIVQMFAFLKEATEGIFSPANCIMAMLIIMAGMLLYCALAAMGGAMASKAEDLSATNIIFTLILVVSFFAVLFGKGLMSGEVNPILDWIPFTSVLITPARTLMGALPLWKSIGSFAVTLITILIATFIAGKIYKTLVLYRGDTISPKNLIKMLRGK